MDGTLMFYYPEGIPRQFRNLEKDVRDRVFENNYLFLAGIPCEMGIQGSIDEAFSTILLRMKNIFSKIVGENVMQHKILFANLNFRRLSSPIPNPTSRSIIYGSSLSNMIVIGEDNNNNNNVGLISAQHKPDKILAVPLSIFSINETLFNGLSEEEIRKNLILVPILWVDDVDNLSDEELYNLIEETIKE